MTLPSMSIAEAVALLLWMSSQVRDPYAGRVIFESARDCVTGGDILSAARYHYRRRSTCVGDDYERCAAYILFAVARGLHR